ncbi:response regulator transcription factor [Dactylosporangium sp. NPDC049525]|uniref:response regulator transcription factor n=1 Tax=Dactylosporangium sp. NPDC049525 TaxID=3154730 RepID=UPI00341D3FAD
MSVRVAVVDPLPMFSRGVLATLGDAGFEAEVPADVPAWVRAAERHIVLLTLASPQAWALLTSLRRIRADLVVVAVLDEHGPAASLRALAAGAVGIVPRDATPAQIRDVVAAALNGACLLPIEVLRALVAPAPRDDGRAGPPSEQEIGWLRLLATGATVPEVATRTGYSERMMFRLLRALYAKLGVANRTEAIMHAHDRGWV